MKDAAPANWTAYEHPEGALYFHHESHELKNIFTDASLGTQHVLETITHFVYSFEYFVAANGIRLEPKTELVLDLEEAGEDEGRCGYYLVDHQNRSVFWLDAFETADLPDWNEVPGVTADAHIRHELEAQYWLHCELFPHTREVTQDLVDELRDMLTHALGDVSTSPLSTIESTEEELKTMLQAVTAAESKYSLDLLVALAPTMTFIIEQVGKPAPGSMCLLSRFMHIRARHRFINFHGQPAARLCRNQAIYDESDGRSYLITLLSPMLFSAPEVHLRMLRDIYVDQVVYATHINKVISRLNNEWQEFILYATVLLNANVAVLAIQSVDDGGADGARTPVQISSYLSIAMSIGSIILGLLLVRQNRTKGKESAPEAMRFMSRHSLEILAILYSLPYALLMWAMLAFVGSFSFLCFDSTSLVTRLLVGAVGHEPWWKSAFEKLVASVPQEQIMSTSEHAEHGDERHVVDGEASKRGSWRLVEHYDQRGFGRTALDAQNRTPGSMYGKTTWANQLDDLEWAINTVQGAFHGVPIFLMGCSMGGGIVLGYMARQNRPSETDTLISGVIAGSPCVKLTREPPKALLWVAHQISRIHLYMPYPLRNKPEDLSRNEDTNAAYNSDPLVGVPGSLRSLEDMITEGGRLLTDNYVHWPEDVAVLFLHGTADQVTSPVAAQQLYDKLPAKRKKMITYPGARHELHNEPDGVKEKSLLAIVNFIRSHQK
ncbi:hypothetical protein CCMSSC00406_0005558 [Pleurotus cornucopiae]|uniref:Uncharacterized protein n=1 Tax=Pleurotus cornucopiae TaxID=5321 RepID=A0ACB7IU56_PLECO|nr:hypothetical protein CCMSSC00406_0005558 [Pleurotus cornucopiae]